MNKEQAIYNKLTLKLALVSKVSFGEKSLQYLSALREMSKVHCSTFQFKEAQKVLET